MLTAQVRGSCCAAIGNVRLVRRERQWRGFEGVAGWNGVKEREQ